MDRRRFLLSALAGPLVAPLAVHAQGTAKLPKLGVLYTNTAITPAGLNPAFWERLRELGWDNNPVFTVNRDRVVALAAKSRLPAIYEYASWPNASTRSFAAPGRSTCPSSNRRSSSSSLI